MEVCDMTDFTVDRKKAIAFLSSFGESVEDLLVMVAGARLTGTVANSQFFLRKQAVIPPIQIQSDGKLGVSDLKKVVQFCKKGNNELVRFTQQDVGRQLTVRCGGMTLKIPTMKEIGSHAAVPAAEKSVKKAEDNMFTTHKNKQLEGHGEINVTNLKSLSGFQNFFTYPNFLISIHPEEGEFFIKAGKQGTMQLTIDTVLDNAQGPNKRLESRFGKWLMPCVAVLDGENASVHMGEGTSLFLVQNDNLLVVQNEA